jgi:hypothetical protein
MPAALNEMADRRSAAADFCNKICQIQTCALQPSISIRFYSIALSARTRNGSGMGKPDRLRYLERIQVYVARMPGKSCE